MTDKITLDRNTFKALAADTRISILKELQKRRKTQSELAGVLQMSVSTIKEHLDTLESVDLVKQIDEGYKWKYYELTKKGRNIICPSETRIWISLAIMVIALGAALNNLLSKLMELTGGQPGLLRTNTMLSEGVRGAADNVAEKSAAPQAFNYAQQAATQPIPYADLALVVILAIIIGAIIGYILRTKKV